MGSFLRPIFGLGDREEKRMMAHDWDEDAICTRCGFDGAEWMHWKHFSYEGKASDAKMPTCKYRPHLSPIYPFIPMKPIPAPGTT